MSEVTDERADDALDREQIEFLIGLDDGAGEVLAEIVGEYLAMAVELRAETQAAMDQGDLDAARRLAHTFKGASANVGARRLAEVCAEIEAYARNGDRRALAALPARFEHEYACTSTALRSVCKGD
jgi:histidine phosphotransfer protein HptB